MRFSKMLLTDQDAASMWDDFVISHPLATPYHLSSWLLTIYYTYFFRPYLFVQKNENKTICGVLPLFYVKGIFGKKRMISLPFSDYGGPLLLNDCAGNAIVKHFECLIVSTE